MTSQAKRKIPSLTQVLCTALIATLPMQTAMAQMVDISNVPLAKMSTIAVRANLMFILDDSGSMDWEFLPGATTSDSPARWCFGYEGINRIFYDPDTKYPPPVNYDGTSMANASFTAAWDDGFIQSGSKNLSTVSNLSTPAVRYDATTSTSRYYYAKPLPTGSALCSSDGQWTNWNIVRSSLTWTAEEKTNYANWYSYYRSRMLLMRSAVGRVFQKIDATRFRVGYSAISSTSYVNSNGFLPIGDFDNATQKQAFFNKVYNAPTTGSTPLRPALEKIGKYYAKRKLNGAMLDSGVTDPVQYACQKNYAILSTDGYWNTGSESSFRSSYVPTQLNGTTAIGNPDGATTELRPFRDDGRTTTSGWVVGGTGTANTLADIAHYFYTTDLRQPSGADGGAAFCTGAIAGQDVCDNKKGDLDTTSTSYQNMRTFTVGLGVAGNLTYRTDYEEATTGSFADIKAGRIAWPKVVQDSPTAVDDLWHAAVNGRGRYFSAMKADDLEAGLRNTLSSITSVAGVAAAAATSSLQPVEGDNFMFIGEYTTVRWEGNLRAHLIDPTSGIVSKTPLWQARDTVKAQVTDVSDTRKIMFRNPLTGLMADFTATNLTTAGLDTHFKDACVAVTGRPALTQCATYGDAAKTVAANSTENMVNYIRGRWGYENTTTVDSANRLYRTRTMTPLGDIVNASPVYVKRPPFKYVDAGYNDYRTAKYNRRPVVYLAANDGMLHAIDAETGSEVWAYVPTATMKHMRAMADENYGTNHRFMVDGTPVVGDIFHGGQWRTILVGGFNSGGRGYYALDISDPDPANVKVLWEISETQEPNLGLTYGNPIITKADTGNWIVAFSSGYNNVSPGDGNGHVFIREAYTGTAIKRISTFEDSGAAAGSTTSPNNLSKLNGWVESETNNYATRLYAGDLKGNVWRIEYDGSTGTGSNNKATVLGYVTSPSGARQPITTKPMLAVVTPAKYPVVIVATGRFVGQSDVTDTSVQSLYIFREKMLATGYGSLRARTGSPAYDMIQKTMTTPAEDVRRLSTQSVDWSTKLGWMVDLSLSSGERVNVDMVQTGPYLGMASNIPAPTPCNPGGSSWVYSIHLDSAGNGVTNSNGTTTGGMTSLTLDTMTAGLNVVRLRDEVRLLVVDTNGKVTTGEARDTSGVTGTVRRRQWREVLR